jgi:ABC-type transport system involved in cytochrome c biogenesis permease component
MVHIILKILGYVELFQKEYKSGCSQMEFLVMDESTAGEIYKRKGAVDITSNED